MSSSNKLEEKLIAETLFVVKGHTQQSISELLKVSYRSINKWVKMGNWKEKRKAEILKTPKIEMQIVGFLGFIATQAPGIFDQLATLQKSYLKQLKQ